MRAAADFLAAPFRAAVFFAAVFVFLAAVFRGAAFVALAFFTRRVPLDFLAATVRALAALRAFSARALALDFC